MSKTLLTFYCDDTNPYDAPASAYRTFLNFIKSAGIAGEASFIPAYGWNQHGLLTRPETDEQAAFIEQACRAEECGVDVHCELMTHAGIFDFQDQAIPPGAVHEGVWTYLPEVTLETYQAYFGAILAEGERIGVRYSGVTWPGCGCDDCNRRYTDLHARGIWDVNPNAWQALLNLARQGRFRRSKVPCFPAGAEDQCAVRLKAGEGRFAVYDLVPNLVDRFGIWLNDPAQVDPDYYISANGQAGRIVELARTGAPYALFYAHWQGLNPANGAGWKAFTAVVARVEKYLKDSVVWVRPSDALEELGELGEFHEPHF